MDHVLLNQKAQRVLSSTGLLALHDQAQSYNGAPLSLPMTGVECCKCCCYCNADGTQSYNKTLKLTISGMSFPPTGVCLTDGFGNSVKVNSFPNLNTTYCLQMVGQFNNIDAPSCAWLVTVPCDIDFWNGSVCTGAPTSHANTIFIWLLTEYIYTVPANIIGIRAYPNNLNSALADVIGVLSGSRFVNLSTTFTCGTTVGPTGGTPFSNQGGWPGGSFGGTFTVQDIACTPTEPGLFCGSSGGSSNFQLKPKLQGNYTQQSTVDSVVKQLDQFWPAPESVLPDDAYKWLNVQEAHRRLLHKKAEELQDAKPTGWQRIAQRKQGIIITAGGNYFASGFVTIAIMRRLLKTQLPIELWYLGKEEMFDWQRKAISQFSVELKDATEIRGGYRLPISGYGIKSLAILHTSLKDVYFSDPDSFPLVAPEELFADKKFLDNGAVFCKDQGKFDLTSQQCSLLGIPHTDQAGFEMGQFLIDRHRQWKEINLWRWLDDHADYYYNHGLGDCLTAKIAWRYWRNTNFTWASNDRWTWEQPAVLHNWNGRGLTFVHRINGKLKLGYEKFQTTQQPPPKYNDKLPFEKEAWSYLEELRSYIPKGCCE